LHRLKTEKLDLDQFEILFAAGAAQVVNRIFEFSKLLHWVSCPISCLK
jgi:hypothetical protein